MSYLVLQSSRWGRELISLLLLCSECHVAVIILKLFLLVEWVVAFPGHTHLRSDPQKVYKILTDKKLQQNINQRRLIL